MKRMKLLIVFSFLSIAGFAVADDSDDVRCTEIAFSQSVENHDITAFTSFIDADARFVSNSVSRGPAEVTEAWSVFFAEGGPDIKWRPQTVEVLKDGNLALSRGPYRMISRDAEGELIEYWGTFNSVWRKQADDSWKVVFDAGNVAAEAPPEDTQALLDQENDCR